jgi:nitroimidazol reductase NimA-like FMN-containing flavoprotein (pyridoxamine 5'-phosphate oxidase superfamily)
MTDTEQQDKSWMGKNSKLTPEELAEFLAGPMVARVATIDEEGLPYITPVWQEWDGDAMWIIPRERSAWVNHIKLHPKVAVSVAEDSGTYKRVLMRGTAEIISGPEPLQGQSLEIANRMATRFLGEHGPDYLVPSIPNPRYLIKFVPDSMITWDGVGWAKKYTE